MELDKHTSAPKRKAESAALQASEPNVPDALSYLYERTQCTGAASKGGYYGELSNEDQLQQIGDCRLLTDYNVQSHGDRLSPEDQAPDPSD